MLNLFLKNTSRFLPFISCFLLSAFCFLHACFAQVSQPRNVERFVYQSSVSLAYGVGENFGELGATFPNTNFSAEVQQLIAYQFNHYFYTGGGAGLDFWFNDKRLSVFIPIFANATVKFMEKKLSPFLYVNIGYAFKWQVEKRAEDDLLYGTKAGLYFQTGFGFNIKFSDRFSLLLSPYYKLQMSAIDYRKDELLFATTKNQLFHFLGVKIGFLY